MRRLMRRTTEERGFALVMALLVLAALAVGLTTAIMVSSSSGRTATSASAEQVAYNAAEAGVNFAMATLHASSTNALNSAALPSTTTYLPVGCTSACASHVTWGGVLNTDTQTWTITSTGYATNSASPDLPDRKRTLTATSYVQPDLSQTVNNQVWNYIYSFGKGGATSCDVHLEQNVVLTAPIYAEGNLCFENGSSIQGKTNDPPTPVNVVVKGATRWASNGGAVGTSANPVVEAHLAGGCGTSFSSLHTCSPDSPTNDPIHVTGTFDTSPTSVSAVAPDFEKYYTDANPGPMHPCNAATAVNPPTFDSDTTQDLTGNGDAPAYGTTTPNTFNLTPSTSYTCKGFDSSGALAGQISWNATTRVLTVAGVIYYDGNLTFSGISRYVGQATFYATGWLDVPGAKMCGALTSDGSDCDYVPGSSSGWDPNTTMLIVVCNGHDSGGNSVNFSDPGAHWQGGLYANDNLNFKNNAVVEGPIIAGYLDFNQNVSAVPFPVINSVPTGAPGNPNVYADALPPTITG